MIQVPAEVKKALAALRAAGYEAYPVGGCVRDGLLGLTPQDWDICTGARPEETEAVFAGCRVAETGRAHGTVTVLMDGRALEITTFRRERGYGDRRHPDEVVFVGSLAEDLARRDFTVNAMALAPDGGVIDPFGGRADLAAGLIRCVGEPSERFGEDALRILRAMRFASRLGFAVEENTSAAVHENRALLENISRERIFSELKGLLTGPGAGDILRRFSDVIFFLIPELAAEENFRQYSPYHIHDLWTHTTMAVDGAPPTAVMRLTMLLHDVGKPETFSRDEKGVGHFYGHARAGAERADEILRRLRCDNALRRETVLLIEHHDAPPPQTVRGTRRLLNRLGEETFRRLIACWRADASDRAEAVRERNLAAFAETERLLNGIMEREDCFSLKDLAINGNDLLTLGMAPGPAVGQTLAALFRLVTEEEIPNDRETLLEQAKRLSGI